MATRQPDPGTYYDRIAERHVLPLWVDTKQFVPWEPSPLYAAALWKYDELRPLLIEAGEIVTPEEASRRVLVLQNPALSGFQGTTRSLYACLQLILPGEQAPDHRHTQSALRLVIEGEGAFTSVDGGRVKMVPGDFIITPSWAWHGHTHEGDTPMIWLDGLDNGLMAQLDTTFFEPGRPETSDSADPLVDAPAGIQNAEAPLDLPARLLRFPYDKARENLEILRKIGDADPCQGYRMEYLNPVTGNAAMPTMTTGLMFLERGFGGQTYQCTDGLIFAVLEGAGETVIGEQKLAWKEHDVFVVPSWSRHFHNAATDSVLFCFSDRVVQQKLGVWREARGG
jgi:gentisate 1,2-dioxygenase